MYVCNSKTKYTQGKERERYRDRMDTNPNPNIRVLWKNVVYLMKGEEAPSYRDSLLQSFQNMLSKSEIPPYTWRVCKVGANYYSWHKISAKNRCKIGLKSYAKIGNKG